MRAFALVCLVFAATSTEAATLTWTGGAGNGLIATAGNWSPAQSPASGDLLIFSGTNSLLPQLSSGFTVGSLSFAGGAGAFILGGAGTYTINTSAGVTNNSTSTETINNAITLGIAQTWNASAGNLVFGGNINNGGFLLTMGGGFNTSSSGVISGTGGLMKSGTGTLTLSGANTFSGGLTLNAGTVSISSDGNLGASSGSLTFGGGTLAATNDVIGTRAIIMTGAGVFSESFGNTLEESGAVSGNGNLSVAGNGTLILSGSGSNGTGTTTLTSGVLSLRGTVSLGSGNLTFTSGVLELGNGNFTRALGVAAGQVNMSSASGGAGFSAYGADRTVNLGGSGATVTWGVGNFVASGQTLYLGTNIADHMVDFQNPIDLNGASRTITVTKGIGTGVDAKISGVISGTGASSLVISSVGFAPWNPGTIVLSGINTYAGGTTISAGTLAISQEANLGAIGGGLTINAGTLEVTTGFSTSRTTTLGNATSTFQIDPSQTYTATGAIGGTGALVKTGSGTMVLAVVNTYSGGTTINGGTLSIIANALGSGALTINAGTLEIATGFSTTRAITLGNVASTFQVDPGQTYINTTAFGGTGSLTKTGAGTMVLGATEAYAGSTTVSAGTLQINASERIPNASALTISGGTLDLQTFSETVGAVVLASGSITGTGTGTLTGSSYDMRSGTVTAILAGAAALTKTTSGTVTLSGINTYTGGSTISAGTVVVNGALSLGAITGGLTLNAGTLEIGTGFTTGRTITIGNAASTFQVDASQTYTVTSAIGGTGTLNKTGAGTMTLTGANTYTGATVISNGTLIAGNLTGSALGTTSGITVNASGTLQLGASNQINDTAAMTLAGGTFAKGNFAEGTASAVGMGALTLSASSHIDFGSGTVGILTFASLNPSTFTLNVDNWTGTPQVVGTVSTDRLIFDSDQSSNLASFSFTGFGTGGFEIALGGGFFEVTPIPEAKTYGIGLAALTTLVCHQVRRWRKRVRKSAVRDQTSEI